MSRAPDTSVPVDLPARTAGHGEGWGGEDDNDGGEGGGEEGGGGAGVWWADLHPVAQPGLIQRAAFLYM